MDIARRFLLVFYWIAFPIFSVSPIKPIANFYYVCILFLIDIADFYFLSSVSGTHLCTTL